MKQSLQLRIGQHLTMTPQLQQAIRLLQLSTLELQSEVQDALESNPMLEQDEGVSTDVQDAASGINGAEKYIPGPAEENPEAIPDELSTDSNWEDVFDTGATSFSAPESGGSRDFTETVTVSGEGLRDHLIWQLELTQFSDTDQHIARNIIDAIDDDGYLTTSTEDIHKQLDDRLDIEHDEVRAVLHRIQQFDPIGVGAQDLRENLQLQLGQYDADTPWLKEARILIRDHFNLLSNHHYLKLGSKMKLASDDLQHVIHLIQSLNPRPGSAFDTAEPEYIIPDVYVVKKNEQ
jgi:RNA polymerase sigma-54 factor